MEQQGPEEAGRPRTVVTHFTNLRTLFRHLIEESVIESSPVEAIRPPVFRQDQVQPLLQTSRGTTHRRRDEAIILLLPDTGVRASQLCGLKMGDLDMEGWRCTALEKGNKRRQVCFGRATTKALWQYLREDPREKGDYLFTSDRGTKAGEGLTRCGLLQLMCRLGKVAEIHSARCSPHTFRHTFAVEFLRAGGNVFTLKELLGHESLTIVNRYVALAQADIKNQHQQFSPVDRLRKRAV